MGRLDCRSNQPTLHTSAGPISHESTGGSHLRVRQNRGTPQRKWKKTTQGTRSAQVNMLTPSRTFLTLVLCGEQTGTPLESHPLRNLCRRQLWRPSGHSQKSKTQCLTCQPFSCPLTKAHKVSRDLCLLSSLPSPSDTLVRTSLAFVFVIKGTQTRVHIPEQPPPLPFLPINQSDYEVNSHQ